MFVKAADRRIHNVWWIESLQRRPTRFRHSCRLVFEESLIGRHFAGLRRPGFSFEFLQSLPTEPAEFVVVPHVDEGPARAGILKIGVVQIRAVNSPVVVHDGWNVKVSDLFAM